MVNNTEILLGIAIVGIIVIAFLSVNTMSKIALVNSQAPSQIRMTPEQYFGGMS